MRQASVLIVGGDPAVRSGLRALLTEWGDTVVGEADNGGQALAQVRSLRPDVVLLAVSLPALSGIEVARTVSAERLAAALLFADTLGDAEAAAIEESGAMGFFSLPVRAADLRVALPLALARFRERNALEEEVRTLNERMEARKQVGRAKAILMEKHGLTEREAFRRIQTQSLTLNKPVHEIARAIITASEMALGVPSTANGRSRDDLEDE